ncbi:MAG: hypothetical protein II034_10165 [Muribaculaceae bacterium]|nr:hypothetical protein [Muribaculaceae bacterium]
MAKRDKFKVLKQERRELRDKIINFFNAEDKVPYNYKQVAAQTGANTPKLRALVIETMEQLAIFLHY